MSCSFLDIVGGVCGAEERARHPSTQTVSLSSCSKDIRSYKRFLQFSGVETEIELIGKRDFCEARQFFGIDCLPVTSIKPWNRMEKS